VERHQFRRDDPAVDTHAWVDEPRYPLAVVDVAAVASKAPLPPKVVAFSGSYQNRPSTYRKNKRNPDCHHHDHEGTTASRGLAAFHGVLKAPRQERSYRQDSMAYSLRSP
jgi:hypothetical protein